MKRPTKCEYVRSDATVSYPSSNGSQSYAFTVRGVPPGSFSCSCPGFQFRGACKHVKTESVACGWSGAIEPGTDMCPECGHNKLVHVISLD